MADSGTDIIPIGLLLEMTGAFMMATPDVLAGRFFFGLPDLPVLRQGVRASELEKGRRQLLDTGTLTRDDRYFEQVMEVIREQWDGRFSAVPQSFVFDDHPGSQAPMLCVLYVSHPPQVLGDEIAASRRQTEFFRGAGVLAPGASI